jgi:hypothetical protein
MPGAEVARSRALLRHESSRPAGNRSRVATPARCPGGNAPISGEKTGFQREITHRGRRAEAADSGLPERAADASRDAKSTGRPGHGASGLWWMPAHLQSHSLRSFCRDGDGNIAESGSMWANGRVQSAVAELMLDDRHAGTLPVWQHAGGAERLRRSLTYLVEP